MAKKYQVTAERDGKWWVLQSVEYPNAISQVKKLSDACEWISEPLSLIIGKRINPDQIELSVRLKPGLQEQVDRNRAEVIALALTQAQVAAESRAIARKLKAMKMTGVDIATVLNISPQRVSQLLK